MSSSSIPSSTVTKDLRHMLGELVHKMEVSETGAFSVPREEILNYKLIPAALLKGESKRQAHRINSL